MKIDLCKVFGVEEGEEFKFKSGEAYCKYIISCNELVYYDENKEEWVKSCKPITINDLPNLNIIKLPKKKEFADDELAIMRSLPKKYKWIARDFDTENVFVCEKKPTKNEHGIWISEGDYCLLIIFNHLFKAITSKDEEPVCIDDYVERGAE